MVIYIFFLSTQEKALLKQNCTRGKVKYKRNPVLTTNKGIRKLKRNDVVRSIFSSLPF